MHTVGKVLYIIEMLFMLWLCITIWMAVVWYNINKDDDSLQSQEEE